MFVYLMSEEFLSWFILESGELDCKIFFWFKVFFIIMVFGGGGSGLIGMWVVDWVRFVDVDLLEFFLILLGDMSCYLSCLLILFIVFVDG